MNEKRCERCGRELPEGTASDEHFCSACAERASRVAEAPAPGGDESAKASIDVDRLDIVLPGKKQDESSTPPSGDGAPDGPAAPEQEPPGDEAPAEETDPESLPCPACGTAVDLPEDAATRVECHECSTSFIAERIRAAHKKLAELRARPDDLKIETTEGDGSSTVRLEGTFAGDNAIRELGPIVGELKKRGCPEIVFDFTGVRHVDVIVGGAMMQWYYDYHEREHRIVIRCRDRAYETFDTLGLGQFLKLENVDSPAGGSGPAPESESPAAESAAQIADEKVNIVAIEERLTPVPSGGERGSEQERWNIEAPPKFAADGIGVRCIAARAGLVVAGLVIVGLAFVAGVLWASGG